MSEESDTPQTDEAAKAAPAKKTTTRRRATSASKSAASKTSATRKSTAASKTKAAPKTTTTKAAPKKTAKAAAETPPTKPAAKPAARKNTTASKKTSSPKKAPSKKTTAAKSAQPVAEPTSETKDQIVTASAASPEQQPKAAASPETEGHNEDSKSPRENQTSASGAAEGMQNDSSSKEQRDWVAAVERGAYMLLFGFLAWFALSTGFVLSVIQFVILLVTGTPNDTIRAIISTIGRYVSDVMSYLSFESETLPFPLEKDLPTKD